MNSSVPKSRIWLWIARIIASIAAGLVVATMALLGGVLFTETGSRWALNQGLKYYNQAIAGEIRVDDFEGRIGSSFRVGRLQILDRQGLPLVDAAGLGIEWSLLSLFRGAVIVDALALDRGVVRIPAAPDERGRWADLAPPSQDPKPRTTLGPHIPLSVRGALQIRRLDLIRGWASRKKTIVADGSLLGTVEAEGTTARLGVEQLSLQVPNEDIVISKSHFQLEWADPVATISDLVANTNAGLLDVTMAQLDLRGWVGRIQATAIVDEAFAAKRLRRAVAEPITVIMRGQGRPEHLELEISGTVDQVLSLSADLVGHVRPRIDLGLDLRMEGNTRVLGGTGPSNVSIDGRVDVAGENLQAWQARFDLDCRDCGGGQPGTLAGEVNYEGSNLAHGLDVHAQGDVAGVRLDAHAKVEDGSLASAQWELETVEGLEPPLKLARSVVNVPEVHGTVRSEGRCFGLEHEVYCEASLGVDDFAGFGTRVESVRARGWVRPNEAPIRLDVDTEVRGLTAGGQRLRSVDLAVGGDLSRLAVDIVARHQTDGHVVATAEIEPKSPFTVHLHQFALDLRGVKGRLLAPATVTASAEAVSFDELRLAVDRGRIDVDGRLGWKTSSDLDLWVRDLDLAQLTVLAPRLRLQGWVDARGTLRGPPSTPSLDLWLQSRGLHVRGIDWGTVNVDAGYDASRLRARVFVDGGAVRAGIVTADVPLSIDLNRRRFRIGRHGHVNAQAQVQEIRLAAVSSAFSDAPVEGTIRLEASVQGTPRRPEFGVELEGHDLTHDGIELGGVWLSVNGRPGIIEVAGQARTPFADRMEIAATIPAELRLVGPDYYALVEDDHAQLDLRVEAFRLESLSHFADIRARGEIDWEAWGVLTQSGLRGRTEARATGLEYNGKRIGFARLVADYGNELAQADLEVRGPIASSVEVHARLPVRLEPGQFEWYVDRPHSLQADVSNLDVARLDGLVPVPSVTGRLSAALALDGTLHHPRGEVSVIGKQLTHRQVELGDFRAGASYQDEKARVHAALSQRGRWAEVEAEVPIVLDPARRQIRWLEDREHRLDLRVSRFRETWLSPWFEMPPDSAFVASAIVRGQGTVADFELLGDVGGRVIHPGLGAIPFEARVSADSGRQVVHARLGPSPTLDLDLTVQTEISTAQWRRGALDFATVPVRGSLDMADTRLESLAGLLPSILDTPTGTLRAAATADGVIAQPNLKGAVAIADGAVTIVPLQQRFKDIALRIRLMDRVLRMDHLTLKSGKGRVRGEGQLQLAANGIQGEVDIEAKDFPLVRPGFPVLQVDAKVRGRIAADRDSLEATVNVGRGKVDVIKTNVTAPSKIPNSDRITYVDLAGRMDKDRRKGVSDPGEKAAPEASGRALKLRFALEDPVDIVGGQFDMRWDGGVTLAQRGAERTVQGAIVADGGTFELLGHQFRLREGQVTLPSEPGEVDPYLNVVAVTDTPEALVTVRVHGRASEPNLDLSSDAGLSESQIFTLLVTGSTQSSDGDQENVQAEAANLLATFSNPRLRQELKTSLGIDRAGVSFGENVNQPILTAGKRITRDVYVETEYHHNAPEDENDVEVRVEYRFRPRWAVETYFGNEAEGGINLYWRRFFGLPTRRSGLDSDQKLPDSARENTTGVFVP